jgi:hypothetical protein
MILLPSPLHVKRTRDEENSNNWFASHVGKINKKLKRRRAQVADPNLQQKQCQHHRSHWTVCLACQKLFPSFVNRFGQQKTKLCLKIHMLFARHSHVNDQNVGEQQDQCSRCGSDGVGPRPHHAPLVHQNQSTLSLIQKIVSRSTEFCASSNPSEPPPFPTTEFPGLRQALERITPSFPSPNPHCVTEEKVSAPAMLSFKHSEFLVLSIDACV